MISVLALQLFRVVLVSDPQFEVILLCRDTGQSGGLRSFAVAGPKCWNKLPVRLWDLWVLRLLNTWKHTRSELVYLIRHATFEFVLHFVGCNDNFRLIIIIIIIMMMIDAIKILIIFSERFAKVMGNVAMLPNWMVPEFFGIRRLFPAGHLWSWIIFLRWQKWNWQHHHRKLEPAFSPLPTGIKWYD